MNKKLLSLIVILAISITASFAQTPHRNCGTVEYMQQQMLLDPTYAQRLQQIEDFTNNYVQNNSNAIRTVVTIPVVVHVVYNTTAQNISDTKVQAQISQLNLDYARMNTDAGNTPSAFQGVSVNTNIQFCLAQQTPSGASTNGIERRQTSSTSFSTNNNVKHTSTGGMDAWNASSYLNLWVCNLGGGLLGYAQFPGGSSSTDGVVVLYSSVGSMINPGTAVPYHLGRTATHEVGHWLNLAHIWGDDGSSCSGTDNVNDTPNQSSENYGCPSFPRTDNCTSGNGVMFMNYMDYTDDACMNMLTAGQSSRMNALFASGGARQSITTSIGCTAVGGGGCGTPGSLSASSITSTTATISWGSVSGATSYNVNLRLSGTAGWWSYTSASTSIGFTGLTAQTGYDFQVQAVCASGTGSFSSIASFTTTSSGGGCTDVFEPNNTKNTAATVSTNVNVTGLFPTTSDIDWFKFANTSTNHNIKITLTTLPFDYDVRLYNPQGNNVAVSQNGGTASETIIYNTSTLGTWTVKVYPYSGSSATLCYTLNCSIGSAAFRLEDGEVITPTVDALSIFPNPVHDNMTVKFTVAKATDVAINVVDMAGRIVYTTNVHAFDGENAFDLDMNLLANGMYMCEVQNGQAKLVNKFMIQK